MEAQPCLGPPWDSLVYQVPGALAIIAKAAQQQDDRIQRRGELCTVCKEWRTALRGTREPPFLSGTTPHVHK